MNNALILGRSVEQFVPEKPRKNHQIVKVDLRR
jgi:hypothetical protein